MPDKGNVMSQAYYEKQFKLYGLYHESFCRKELDAIDAISALRIIGFSDSVAVQRVNEWAAQSITFTCETDKERNRRLKQLASLEKYVLYMRLGKKYYTQLKSKYKTKELSRSEIMSLLIQTRHSQKLAECIMEKWEKEK